MCLITEFFSGQEEEREEQQTSDNIQLVFKLQIFFLLLPQERSVKPFIPKKKKKKASQLGCVFN